MQAIAQMMRHPDAAHSPLDLKAVEDHICRLLNSRQTQHSSAPDYGFALHSEQLSEVLASLPQSLAALEQALIATLTAHEKRLCNWRLQGRTNFVGHVLTIGLWAQTRDAAAQVVNLHCVFAPHRRVEASLWV